MNKLLIFSASWCKPCQMMKPVIDELNSPQVIKYDFDKDKDKVEQYRVPGVPCYILVDDNNSELDIVLGVTTKDVLEGLLSR